MRRRVSLRLRYRRPRHLLALLLLLPTLAFGAFGLFVYTGRPADAQDLQTLAAVPGATRAYYLTTETYDGAEASTACEGGYHMASLWEILDPSNLRYDASLGYTTDDSGYGPPVEAGWVRTGYSADGSLTAGRANCNAWSSNDVGSNGTLAALTSQWDGDYEDLLAWNTLARPCNSSRRVWCVSDRAGVAVFLPLILR